jgi:hypothetical protein
MEVDDQCLSLATLRLGKRLGTHYLRGWVSPRASLDKHGKSRLYQDLLPRPSSP